MGAARRAWNAADHPRGPGGKFTGGGGGSKAKSPAGREKAPWRQLESGPGKPSAPKNSSAPHAPTPDQLAPKGSWPTRVEPARWPGSEPPKAAPKARSNAPKAPTPDQIGGNHVGWAQPKKAWPGSEPTPAAPKRSSAPHAPFPHQPGGPATAKQEPFRWPGSAAPKRKRSARQMLAGN